MSSSNTTNLAGQYLYYPTAYHTIAAYKPKRRPRRFRLDYHNSSADRKTFRDARAKIRKSVGFKKRPKRPKPFPGSSSHRHHPAYKPWWAYL